MSLIEPKVTAAIVPEKFLIEVVVLAEDGKVFRRYRMDHNDQEQRRVLGEQCHNAFWGGQEIRTRPVRRGR